MREITFKITRIKRTRNSGQEVLDDDIAIAMYSPNGENLRGVFLVPTHSIKSMIEALKSELKLK